jgi:L-malate glycosyltransferase
LRLETRVKEHHQAPVDDRVFLMTDSFETGGSERQFVMLAKALGKHPFEVRLGCLQRKGPLLKGIGEVAEFPLGGSFFTLQAQKARLALARYLRKNAISIAHSFDFYSNLMLIPAARLARVPVLIGSQRQIGDLLTPRQFRAQLIAFRLCDGVVCNSHAAAQRLLARGLAARKLIVIPNALPDEAFLETSPALERVPGLLRVGMIARMNHPVKNHAGFLRAAARLVPDFPNVEFVLAGDGPLRDDLVRMADLLGIAGRVRFLGDRQDIPAVFAALDVSVLPSFSESLPNAILESMAAGVPVVATRVGANSDVIIDGESGLLVPPNDEEKLVEALGRFLKDPLLRSECGRRAREIAKENFSLDHIRFQFEQVYQEMLSQGGRRAAMRPRKTKVRDASSRISVAIVAASPRWIGGQGVQADLLVRHWADDAAVDVRFIPIDPELPPLLRWVERVPYLRTMVRPFFYFRALWSGTRDVDLVHIFSASYWSFLLAPVPAWLISKMRGRKTLLNYHSGEARDHLRHWRTALPVLRRVDRIVVPSRFLADVFREFGLETRVVPNTVDLQQFSYRPRKSLRPTLVCTRGFEPYYSVDLVVHAFVEVKNQFPHARLWLVGKGILEQAIRGLVRDLDLTGVEFTGPVPHQEIARFYDQADIFINASWLDNMPLSILEAFASGTPVVSTAPEGIRYLIRDGLTGLLCDPGDWHSLAQNVIRLLRDPELASRLAANAYQESHQYCWEVVRNQWLEVYKSMCSPEARETLESGEEFLSRAIADSGVAEESIASAKPDTIRSAPL